MKVLATGGAGFIDRRLVEALLDKGNALDAGSNEREITLIRRPGFFSENGRSPDK